MPCQWCGTFFPPTKYRKRFCDLVCANRWTARNRHTTTGRVQTTKGYILLYRPDHPRASKSGYVMEHRVVMESVLGRLLEDGEVVHHLNGIKSDNVPENLQVMQKRHHDQSRRTSRIVTCPHCTTEFPLRGNVRYVEQRWSSATTAHP